MSAQGDEDLIDRNLWRAVIMQAVEDATVRRPIGETTKDKEAEARAQARAWLLEPSDDFDEICSWASASPAAVRAFARTRIAEADAGRPRRIGSALLTYRGEQKTIPEWAKACGLTPSALHERLKLGWSLDDALTMPTKTRKRRRGAVDNFDQKAAGPAGEARARFAQNGEISP